MTSWAMPSWAVGFHIQVTGSYTGIHSEISHRPKEGDYDESKAQVYNETAVMVKGSGAPLRFVVVINRSRRTSTS